jgi:RND family efflux transporter MFP subunit
MTLTTPMQSDHSFAYAACRPARTLRVLFSLLVGFAAAAGSGCGGEGPAAAQPPAGGGGGGRGGGMPVEVTTLAAAPVERGEEYVGVVRSRQSTTVQPQAEGIITRIHVSSGDRVAPNAPILEIDATAPRAAAASLESVRAAREAEAIFARQQAERSKTLLDAGATSRQEHEQALAQQKAAEAQLKAVEEQIRQQAAELAYYRVTAPTSGVIGDVPVRVGDRVTKATVLTTIDDNTGFEVYINVPVQRAPELKVGLPVRLLNDAGETIGTERIGFIAPSVDETTQTVLAKAPVRSSHRLRTDQFVRAVVVWSDAPALTVPVVSVMRVGGQHFAYVVEDSPNGTVAKMRPVVLGAVVGNAYVVQSGLTAGDRVIVSGLQKIADGAPVTPMPAGGRGPGR